MPTVPDEKLTEATDVEFIDRDAYEVAVTESEPTVDVEPVNGSPILNTAGWAVGAVAVILLAFVIMSRPGLEETAGDERAQTTVPQTTAAPAVVDAEPEVELFADEIPPLGSNLPETLPGVLHSFDELGSRIKIDRTRPRPIEDYVRIVPTFDGGGTSVGFVGTPMIGFDRSVVVLGVQLVVSDSPSVLRESIDWDELLPVPGSGLVLEERSGQLHTATIHPGTDDAGDPVPFDLTGLGAEVLGAWEGSLLVRQADRVWLLDDDESRRPVEVEGSFVSFDGRWLSSVRCEGLGICEIVVGTPDRPDQESASLPVELQRLPVERWAPSVAVSPDGGRVAAVADVGAVPVPIVIDLETGLIDSWGDGVSAGSPMIWSPDGEWLAFRFTNDVMVRNLDDARTWRITLNRDITTLIWSAGG